MGRPFQKDQVRRPAKQNKTESFLVKTAGRMKQTLIQILLLMGLAGNLQGQMAMDTIRLPEVKLEHNRLQTHSIGTHLVVLTPEIIGESTSQKLSDCLVNHSSVYIKQYVY